MTLHFIVTFRQGNIPVDQVSKVREKKQLIDQIIAKDIDEIKQTIDVCGI